MTFICPPELIALAHRLADLARPIARHYFRNDDLVVEAKSTHDPVTIADREIEEEWRAIVMTEYPIHGIWGEEYGRENIDAEWTWIFDPIDGTKVFSLGRATFGCMIGLHHKEHGFVLGLIDQPIIDLRWFGAKGYGATLNGKKLQTKMPNAYSEMRTAVNNPSRLTQSMATLHNALKEEIHFTSYSGDCLNYAGIADGMIHFYFDTDQKIYDIAAAIAIIEEAGGKITEIDGSPITLTDDHIPLAACTPELHNEILQRYLTIEKNES